MVSAFQSGGSQRSAVIYEPTHAKSGEKLPLMLVFHGNGGTGEGMERTTALDATADRNGFIVAYPDSIGPKWKPIGNQSDVPFVMDLIARLETQNKIDPDRIYLVGYSQGGGMAQALACLQTDRFAGVADVSEDAGSVFESKCRPSRPISFLLFHGTADLISPYEGRDSAAGKTTDSAQGTAAFWVRLNGCSAPPVTTRFADRSSDGTMQSDTLQQWKDCRNGTHVSFYTLGGEGHAWPGSPGRNPLLGSASSLNAGDLIWQNLSQTQR